jgi:hypothetical protein
MITSRVRDLLIEHIDGPRMIFQRERGAHTEEMRRIKLVRQTVALGLLRFGTSGPAGNRPKVTSLTDAGREELAIALADWADALVRCRRFEGAQATIDALRETALGLPNETGEVAEAKHLDEVL